MVFCTAALRSGASLVALNQPSSSSQVHPVIWNPGFPVNWPITALCFGRVLAGHEQGDRPETVKQSTVLGRGRARSRGLPPLLFDRLDELQELVGTLRTNKCLE